MINLTSSLVAFLLVVLLSGCGGGGGDSGSSAGNNPKPDTTPNIPPLITPAQPSKIGAEVIQSFTVRGISQAVSISISGGVYAIDDGEFTDQSGTVKEGQVVKVKLAKSQSFGEVISATLTIGTLQVTVRVVTEDEDLVPDNFTFNAIDNVALGSTVVFEPVTIDGINNATPISITGGEYSIDGSVFTSDTGVISQGQTLRLRLVASSEFSTETTATVTIGGISASVSVTTENEDLVPDNFAFNAIEHVTLGAIVLSSSVSINGINNASPISITGGEYSIDGGVFTSVAGLINQGQTLQLRLLASSEFSTVTSATVTIGGVSASISTLTEAEDFDPNPFAFAPATNVQPASIASSVVIITGINTPIPVSITGGQYAIDDGEFTSEDGLITNGQQLKIQTSAATEWEAITTVDVNVGSIEASWSVTTMKENILPTAQVIFPLSNSSTTEEKITVRGVAKDNTDIESVTVNGVLATLSNRTETAEGMMVDWLAKIELADGNQTIRVDVLDTKDNLANSAANFNFLKTYSLPHKITFVDEGQKIWGNSGWNAEMIDLATNSKHSVDVNMIGNGCYLASNHEYFFLQSADPNARGNEWVNLPEVNLVIKSYDFDSDTTTSWGSFVAIAPNSNDAVSTNTLELKCDATTNRVYAISSLSRTGIAGYLGQVTQLSIDNMAIEILLRSGDEGLENWTLAHAGVSGDMLATLNSKVNGDVSIYNLATAEFENVFSPSLSIVEGMDIYNGKIYLTTIAGIYSYNSEGVPTVISEVESNDPFAFDSVSSSVSSTTGNIIVKEGIEDALIKVDTATGVRSLLFSTQQTGEGESFVSVSALARNSDASLVYILDSGPSSSVSLVEFNLAQLTRRTIAVIAIEGIIYDEALEINETLGVLYAGFNDVLYEINISTGDYNIIASSAVGSGFTYSAIDALEFDELANELIFVDPESEAIVSLDLDTLHRTLLSNSTKGSGPALDDVNGVAKIGQALYASVAGTNAVYMIDTTSGDRTLAFSLDNCIDKQGRVRDLAASRTYGMQYNPATKHFIFPGWSTREFDLDNNQCLFISGYSLLDIIPSANSEFYFAAEMKQLLYWDLTTGELVTVAK